MHDVVFGVDSTWMGKMLLDDLTRRPRMTLAVLAMAGGTPIAVSRLELAPATHFASLWSAGTVPTWRGCGAVHSLLAYWVGVAVDRGFRYLQADVLPDSRPILKRLGFAELGTTTAYLYGSRESHQPSQ